jgi:16S rRNA (cytosine967-C5)-methyltransferase
VRLLALKVLLGLEGHTLAERLAQPDVEALDGRDRALLQELVLGTLRRRGALDFALGGVVDRPLERLDRPVLEILRLGAHQILNLRVPDHAAVSESVELARTEAPRAGGLVNAALRGLVRTGAPEPPDFAKDPLGWLATAGSLPRWLAERWVARLGPERSRARAEALLRPPSRAFRWNPRVRDRPAVEAAPSAVPGGFVASLPLPRTSALYAQDEGSQLAAALAPDAPLVWDCCAAPGGKALAIADRLPASTVVATESSPRRLSTLSGLVRGWGAANVRVAGADALRPPLRNPVGSILLDAPCSGLGTLSRHPDIRWRAREADLPRHAERQGALLGAVAGLVARGGGLVYATCSLEPEETTGVVSAFLGGHPDFSPRPLPPWAAHFRAGPYAETLPEASGGDGFFVALLGRD